MHGFASGVGTNAFFILSGAVFSVSFGSRSGFVMQRSKRCELSGSIASPASRPNSGCAAATHDDRIEIESDETPPLLARMAVSHECLLPAAGQLGQSFRLRVVRS